MTDTGHPSFFQQPALLEVYARVPGMRPFRVEERRGGRVVASAQGYLYREPGWKGWFSRRAIVQGGPCIESGATASDVAGLMRRLKDATSGAIYVEIRAERDYSPFDSVFRQEGFAYENRLNVLIPCDTPDAMWRRMDANRRRGLKQSEAAGLAFRYASAESDVVEFYRILVRRYREKVRKPLLPLSFFLEMYRSGIGRILLAYKEDTLLGGMLLAELPGERLYDWYVAALDAEYPRYGISTALYWQAMRYAASSEIPLLDTMGAGRPGETYGVRVFKERFGGRTVHCGRYVYKHRPALYRIGRLGLRLLRAFR